MSVHHTGAESKNELGKNTDILTFSKLYPTFLLGLYDGKMVCLGKSENMIDFVKIGQLKFNLTSEDLLLLRNNNILLCGYCLPWFRNNSRFVPVDPTPLSMSGKDLAWLEMAYSDRTCFTDYCFKEYFMIPHLGKPRTEKFLLFKDMKDHYICVGSSLQYPLDNDPLKYLSKPSKQEFEWLRERHIFYSYKDVSAPCLIPAILS